jgi:hypothetical protein
MLKVGDLVYAPSEVRLLKFNDPDYSEYTKGILPPDTSYITPIKVCRLKAPTNLLLTETMMAYQKYLKVLYDGDEWYIDKNDINTT